MEARQIISYDDITLPYDNPVGSSQRGSHHPPAKKRRRNNNQRHPIQSTKQNVRNDQIQNRINSNSRLEGDGNEHELSRELTHDEIWDDSALIDAWDAAMEEYEAFNGPDKGWKSEPVHRSPLWYNVPPSEPYNRETNGITRPTTTLVQNTPLTDPDSEENSQVLNYDTFVPTHDPALALPNPITTTDYVTINPVGQMASQDEAFSHAINAMYWSGYWTAVYHCHRQQRLQGFTDTMDNQSEKAEEANTDSENGEANVGAEDFVSAQR